jgi:hypothetical protein
METKDESEKIFEQYLDSNGFQGEWIHEPEIKGKRKKPDYLLNWKGENYFFEVKELRQKPNEPRAIASSFDPYLSLRKEINEVRKKFKEYKDYSCSLVVFNVCDKTFRSNPLIIVGAMVGNLGILADFDTEKGKTIAGSKRNAFLGGGKMINYKGKQSQNTTISAIVVLEQFLDNIEVEKAMINETKKHGNAFDGIEWIQLRQKLHKTHQVRREPRLIVVENPYARKPFSEILFNGPFDEHWRWREDLNGKIERLFVGNKLKELEELKGKV